MPWKSDLPTQTLLLPFTMLFCVLEADLHRLYPPSSPLGLPNGRYQQSKGGERRWDLSSPEGPACGLKVNRGSWEVHCFCWAFLSCRYRSLQALFQHPSLASQAQGNDGPMLLTGVSHPFLVSPTLPTLLRRVPSLNSQFLYWGMPSGPHSQPGDRPHRDQHEVSLDSNQEC